MPENPCNWPHHGSPTHAGEMLDDIVTRVLADAQQPPPLLIDPFVLLHILDRAHVCKNPYLRNAANKQICALTKPVPADELRGIWKRTDPVNLPTNPANRRAHWCTIAQDLESFPSGT